MADHHGPWGGPPDKPPSRFNIRGRRPLIWLAVLAVLAAAIGGVSRLAPGRMTDTQWFMVWRGYAILAMVSGGVVYATGAQLRRGARTALIWIAIFAGLMVGYTYRNDMFGVIQRVRGELIPDQAQGAGARTFVVSASEGGHYFVLGSVNGVPVRFLIDTGASDIVLDPADAQRAGINIAGLDYGHLYGTANGIGRGASMTLQHVSIGPISMVDVPVSINRAPMGASLLGMSFLRRLDGFEVRDGRMFLRWKR